MASRAVLQRALAVPARTRGPKDPRTLARLPTRTRFAPEPAPDRRTRRSPDAYSFNYHDISDDYVSNEPAIDYNASLLALLVAYAEP